MSERLDIRIESMKQPVVAIVGAGAVGSTVGYSLIMRGLAAKIIVVDVDAKKCAGEVQDLSDVLSMNSMAMITSGSLRDAGQADIIVITAGTPQKPGQSETRTFADKLSRH